MGGKIWPWLIATFFYPWLDRCCNFFSFKAIPSWLCPRYCGGLRWTICCCKIFCNFWQMGPQQEQLLLCCSTFPQIWESPRIYRATPTTPPPPCPPSSMRNATPASDSGREEGWNAPIWDRWHWPWSTIYIQISSINPSIYLRPAKRLIFSINPSFAWYLYLHPTIIFQKLLL